MESTTIRATICFETKDPEELKRILDHHMEYLIDFNENKDFRLYRPLPDAVFAGYCYAATIFCFEGYREICAFSGLSVRLHVFHGFSLALELQARGGLRDNISQLRNKQKLFRNFLSEESLCFFVHHTFCGICALHRGRGEGSPVRSIFLLSI